MEILDVVDENGNPTGETVERTKAHAEGIRHRTSHVFLLRNRKNSRDGAWEVQVLLQKRSEEKDSFPGCYDISSAGHIPAGSGFAESALRELKEELGIELKESDLHDLGIIRKISTAEFRGKPYLDRQVSRVYWAECDLDEPQFVLQKEEVSAVLWIGLRECRRAAADGSLKNCLYPDELAMLPDEI